MTEHGKVGKLTEPQRVVLKQLEKNMKDMKKVRKLLQKKDLNQTLERYPIMSCPHVQCHISTFQGDKSNIKECLTY